MRRKAQTTGLDGPVSAGWPRVVKGGKDPVTSKQKVCKKISREEDGEETARIRSGPDWRGGFHEHMPGPYQVTIRPPRQTSTEPARQIP
jgi:hypothetical protein